MNFNSEQYRHIVLLMLSAVSLLLLWNLETTSGVSDGQIFLAAAGSASSEEDIQNPFAELDIKAESYIAFDFLAGDIIAKNADTKRPLASLAKLMTAVVAEENLKSEDIISLTRDAILQEGDDGFLVDESFFKDDLRDLMLAKSSNDAAFAIAAFAGQDFVAKMNAKAAELGMDDTYFANPTGLDVAESESGAYSSARDLAVLLKYIEYRHPAILDATARVDVTVRSAEGREHKVANTNKIVDQIPQLVGGKTGFTLMAGGNLAVVADMGLNHPIGIIVMGSTAEDRFSDVLKLYDAVSRWFSLGRPAIIQ